MKVATGSRAVWMMLLLPPVTLAVLVFGYVALAGLSPADPGTEATVRSALGPILIVNHLGLFALLLYLLRRNGEDLADIGWSTKAVDSPVAGSSSKSPNRTSPEPRGVMNMCSSSRDQRRNRSKSQLLH